MTIFDREINYKCAMLQCSSMFNSYVEESEGRCHDSWFYDPFLLISDWLWITQVDHRCWIVQVWHIITEYTWLQHSATHAHIYIYIMIHDQLSRIYWTSASVFFSFSAHHRFSGCSGRKLELCVAEELWWGNRIKQAGPKQCLLLVAGMPWKVVKLVGGDWNMLTIFPYIGNVIIPFD